MSKINIINMYKTMVGWTEYRKDDDKHLPTHKLISCEDWDRINNYVYSLNEKIKDKDQKLYNKEKELDCIRTKYEEKIAEINRKNIADITGLQEEVLRQKSLNDNLLRISKERANAQRGLQPKKKHLGYRYAGKITQIKVVKEHTKKGNVYGSAWSVTMETPYDATIPIDQIKERILNDLFGSEGICHDMGIKILTVTDDTGKINLWTGEYRNAVEKLSDDYTGSFLYDLKYSANAKSGLWEVQLFATGEIVAVSAYF